MNFKIPALLATLFTAPGMADTYLSPDKISAAIKPFIEQGTQPLTLESADLNGDGLGDHVLVLERQNQDLPEPDRQGNPRSLLILIRQPGNILKLAARNDKIIACASCGGVLGDPFQGIKASTRRFEVYLSGGSRERWSFEYTFSYSRKDDTWQLVRVRESQHDTLKPDSETTHIHTPPRDYGKIAITDFDPERWKGQSKR